MFLRMRRNGKLNRFGQQLPEAIDLITRSLKAGHPVPVAISMVAREMPDPIGSEFGMVADEVTYGSDLVTALSNMYARVGHPDLPLLVSSVSIQSTTGGNLREILDGSVESGSRPAEDEGQDQRNLGRGPHVGDIPVGDAGHPVHRIDDADARTTTVASGNIRETYIGFAV